MNTYNPWEVKSVQAFLSLKCPECIFTSKHEKLFQEHAVKNHPLSKALYDNTIFNDSTMRKEFNDKFLSKINAKTIDFEENPDDPEEITEYTLKKENVKKKRKLNNSLKGLRCKICDMIFVQEQFLIKHIEDSHSEGNTVYVNPNIKSEEPDIPIEIYQCSVCNDQFKSVAGVTFHLSTVHEGNKPNTCSDCDYSHKKMNVLKNHIESVHELIRREECEFCESRFVNKSSLRNHINAIHKKKKPFKCSQCDASYVMKSILNSHIEAVHEGKKPNKCSVCDYSCHQKSTLKRHIASVHEKKKPFKCCICSKTFALKQMVAKHFKTVHVGEKPYSCDCGSTFSSHANLKQHINTVHEDNKPHCCSLCPLSFLFPKDLKRHISEVHEKKRPYSCEECDTKFSNKGNFNAHMKKVHTNQDESETMIVVDPSMQDRINDMFLESIKMKGESKKEVYLV